MKNLQILSFILFSIYSLTAIAQISEGGMPPSFTHSNNLRATSSESTDPPIYNVPVNIDLERIKWEDTIVERDGGGNRSFAVILPVENIGTEHSGRWTELDDSTRVWQQSIKAEGAQGLIISYNNFYIPEGAKLFIYNKDRSQILGSYSDKTNPSGGKFSTEIVFGDELTLEYVESRVTKDKPKIEISDVGYIYNLKFLSILSKDDGPGFGAADSCMINVNCKEGANWQMQKRGVVLMVIKLGDAKRYNYCSGTLINNTLQDKKPYLLTASHCFTPGFSFPEETQFYFNFEFDGCDSEEIVPKYKTLIGADILVRNPLAGNGDATLLYLKSEVPDDYNPFYNGWDIRNISATSGVVIHHPYGDVKKITTYNSRLVTTTVRTTGGTGATNAHWQVIYDGNSITQSGSSGSPLFNEYGLVIGTLSAGESYCYHMFGPDYFGKLWYNWYQDVTTGKSGNTIAKYLDPINLGSKVLPGIGILNGVEQKMDLTVGIEDDNKWKTETKDFILFPNPVRDQLNINSNSIMKSINITNMQGKLVYRNNDYNSSTLSISLDELNKGTYAISVKTEEGKVYNDKFIKN